MFSKKSAFVNFLIFILFLTFLLSPNHAKAGPGAMGTVLGGALVVVGGITVHEGMQQVNTWCTCAASPDPSTKASCLPGCTKGKVDIAKGILEMAGGAAALMMNSKNDNQLKPNQMLGGLTAGTTTYNNPNLPNGPTPSIPDKCKEFPQLCKCNDSACNQPTLQLPAKDELDKLMRIGGTSKSIAPDGTTLDQALAKLNDNYDKAKDAVDAFNQQSAAGAFLPDGSGGGLAGDSSGSRNDYMGLNKDASNGASQNGAGSDFPSNAFNNNTDLDNLKKIRGEPEAVTKEGLNLRNNNTDKLLTIFERAARVLRGDRNRDISLAKIEWVRKESLKKQGNARPSISSPKQ